MKKLAVLLVAVLFAAPAFAGDTGILKLSLWDNIAVALPNNTNHITGINLGIGAKTDKVDGVQLDLISSKAGKVRGLNSAYIYSTAHELYGVQGGIYNTTDIAVGLQGGLVAVNRQEITGLQGGAINIAKGEVTGVQLGLYNQVADLHGLQLGFVNNAHHISKGLQLGIVNIAKNGWLPVMVLVNGRF